MTATMMTHIGHLYRETHQRLPHSVGGLARTTRERGVSLTYPKASVCRLDHKHGDVASQHALVVILLADHDTKALLSVKGQPTQPRPAV